MAEFKLGRIRFVWKDEWSSSTSYYVDDVVRVGGKTYICQVGHTSSADFYTDLNYSPTKWNEMTDGQEWRGDWTVSTFYRLNDLVKYGAIIYLCTESHTSAANVNLGLEVDQSKWTTFAEATNWRGDWATAVSYKVNDIVRYGGYTYICNETHTSAATTALGLEADQAKWDIFNPGIEYKGAWSGSSVRYKRNDVVKYGAGLWVCTTHHTSTASFVADQANWTSYVKGFEFESDWMASTVYQQGDIVRYGGNQYIAKTNHSSATLPLDDSTNWDLFTQGFKFQGAWSISSSYKIGDVVTVAGNSYVATLDSPSVTATVTDTSSVSNSITVSSTTNMFAGMAVRFTGVPIGILATNTTYYVKQVLSINQFTISDTFSGATKSLTTASGTMTATAAAHPTNIGRFSILSSGFNWRGDWVDDTEYDVGDSVSYNNINYLCVTKHRSEGDDGSSIGAEGGGAANSRPDQDTTGAYWNLLTVGSESSVLTTRGDLVYYGGAGPTRLPIGIQGQVLKSNGTDPEWVQLGVTDQVYYVAPHGVDLPAPIHGKTWDQPWKTIRYACEQVEKGPRNPNAQYLLELNRAFIQREVSSWIRYQIENNTTPFKNVTVTDINSNDTLTTATAHGLTVGTKLRAKTTSNGIVAETDYYVTEIGEFAFKLSLTSGGSNITSLVNGTGLTINLTFDYDEYKCERDVGFIVDRLQWDLGHGGNLKIRAAAQSLLGILSEGPFSVDEEDSPYITLADERVQGITAYNYMLQVVEAVLSNEAPAVEYQNAIDDSTTIVEQYINLELTTEPGVVEEVRTAISVITNALANPTQDTPGLPTIPERYVPSTLINVATGQYRETLPIIVPAYTCVLGDELRSTNAGPAGSTVDLSDSYYTVKTFDHVEAVIGDVVGGVSVTPTSGNGVTQYTSWPVADIVEQTAVVELIEVMKQQVDFRLNTLHVSNLTDPVGYNSSYLVGYGDARKLIKENKKFLQEEIVTYIDNNYSSLEFIGSISGTTLTVSSITTGILTDSIAIRGTGVAIGTTIEQQLSGSIGGIGTYEVSISQATNPTTMKGQRQYSRTKTRRDAGYIIDAVIYDLTYGGNAQSVAAGLAYFDGDNADSTVAPNLIPFSIRAATLATIGFLKTRMQQVATASSFAPLQNNVAQFTDTAGSAGASTLIGNNLDDIIEIVEVGPSAVGTTVTLTDPVTTDGVSSTTALISAYSTLNSAASTIRTNTINYVNATYPTLVYNSTKCSRDIGIILKAVGYDFMLGNTASITEFTNYQSLKAAHSYLRPNSQEVYTLGQKTVTIDAIEYARTQAIANVGGDTTAIDRINVLMELIKNVIYGASNEGNVCATDNRTRDYAILQLERNKEFIGAEISAYIDNTFTDTATTTAATTNTIAISDTSWLRRGAAIKFTGVAFGGITANQTYYVQNVVSSTLFKISSVRNSNTPITLSNASGSLTVELVYNEALCQRDVITYIDALKWDLKYESNYKSKYVARYYSNAVLGSFEEDMYYLRDGTGIRDQTLEGLSGDLTPENEYGTSRVTAGAYCSLDPGWGPDDFRTWIITRSPYVQGVTTLGTGAIGQKIDGALHNGGNDSIVSNDFTQVISDGIGAWVANNGRAELVSVFTYYSHIGYLSTEGGRIRGTNGNNSYGDFGGVAEGFDTTETPNTGIVDNKFQFVAEVGSVTTTAQEFLGFEFTNAGVEYTDVEWTLTGGGINAVAVGDEFRDDAVYQVRLLQLAEDGNDGEFGGSGYITNSNTAQAGGASQITLAATDSEPSNAYLGMKVVITGGNGVGQFGIIASYNSGTKVATVTKESDGTPGWDSFVAGKTIVNPDASSTYTVEPALTFSAPPYASAIGTGLPAAGTYSTVEYAPAVKTYLSVAASGGNGTGATFNVVKKGTKYIVFVASGGLNYDRLDVLTIAGTALDGAAPTNSITITVTSIDSTNGEILAFDQIGTGQGGNYVALLSGSSTAETSTGGSWTSQTLSASRDWISAAAGKDTTSIDADALVSGTAYKIVSLGDTLFNVVGATSNLVGETFVATGPTSGSGTCVVVNSVIVAIASSSINTTRSVDGGINWTAGGNLPAGFTTGVSVAYGNGYWVAIETGSNSTAYSTDGGQTWSAGGNLPASTTWTSVTYGAGKFVAVASGGTQAASVVDPAEAWTTRTLPASTDWSDVAFGNNRFVAVSSTSGTDAAYSLNGQDWVASTIISADYTAITYGQGTFLAVGSSTTAASSPDGIVWTSRTISTSDSVGVAFGNVNSTGKFVTISNTGSNNASIVQAGTTARARAFVANNKIFEIRLLEPGSGYSSAPTLTITDPNNTFEAPFTVRIGDGVLGTPTFNNRGTGYETGSAEVLRGDGFADNYQPGSFVAVRRLISRPASGSNVVFSNLPDRTFKLVNVVTFRGNNDGSYTGFLQISPQLTITEAPDHSDDVTLRLRYSQVRLTGHDFLDIGTGNFIETNYPGAPSQDPIPANETVENNGGRVFFTASDQDGNFRVGDLFSIEQSTGIATLNADAFNISGLQELNLGEVTLGGGSATITEFSTDPFFTADSDNIVPTQRAIKAFIASQIGGGGASLNVNSVTAGSIFISSNVITTVTSAPISINATFDFRGGIRGIPLAFNFFLN